MCVNKFLREYHVHMYLEPRVYDHLGHILMAHVNTYADYINYKMFICICEF